MARFRYAGGDQRPDVYGVLEVGDVLEFDKKPDWGDWETTSEPAERAPTPQPVIDELEELRAKAADVRSRPKPADKTEQEA